MMEKAPWYWKLAGWVLILAGCGLPLVPRILPSPPLGVKLLFIVFGLFFGAIGILFLKTKPRPSVFTCSSCGAKTRRGKLANYCSGCGRAMDDSEEELKPSEINCPHCLEPIPKGSRMCPKCGKDLPGFGIDGGMRCRWCKTRVQPDEKFCKFCSAPLTERQTA